MGGQMASQLDGDELKNHKKATNKVSNGQPEPPSFFDKKDNAVADHCQETTCKSSPPPPPSWSTFILAFVAIPFVTCTIFTTFYAVLLWLSPNTWLRTLLVIYLLYVALDSTPSRGGYSWAPPLHSKFVENTMRRLVFYRALADYFPVRLIKTVDLPAGKTPYIFAYHPHGVIGVGACATLLTNPTDFDLKFPGIPRRIATLNVIFLIPIFRDWLILMGFISASKSSLSKVLRRNESVVLLPGGAPEALLANPQKMVLSLKRRKGFIKMAMETKASIVPVLGFGENSAFPIHVPAKGSWLFELQKQLCRLFSFSTPFILSPFPLPNPVHVVVGKPVEFDPSKSIDECHAQYLKALEDMYNEHKGKYGHAHIPLEIQ
ncbi:hypothetical protein ACA910_014039 [Epithemia clementina (nom. ined.)]